MPPSFPCLVCSKGVRENSLAISCDVCSKWCHIRCGTGITRDEYHQMTRSGAFAWTCTSCVLNGDMVDAMVSVMEDVVMPDPDHDQLHDASFDVSMIESVHGSFVVPDVHNESAPDLSMIQSVQNDSTFYMLQY